jgi:hypothetical protein
MVLNIREASPKVQACEAGLRGGVANDKADAVSKVWNGREVHCVLQMNHVIRNG